MTLFFYTLLFFDSQIKHKTEDREGIKENKEKIRELKKWVFDLKSSDEKRIFSLVYGNYSLLPR